MTRRPFRTRTRASRRISRTVGACAALFAAPSASWAADPPHVRIAGLDWMTRNVEAAAFRNGDPVPEAVSAESWRLAAAERAPASAIYPPQEAEATGWGRLYNYHAVTDPRGLCPQGWRPPTDQDWRALESALGPERAARRLRSTTGWPPGGEGDDDLGFAGLPAGFRSQVGAYHLGGRVAYYWSSTSLSDKETTAHMLFDYDPRIFRIRYDKGMGMSLRCVR
jgi:uncharacterized protein (TIGR02145 family)